MDDAKFLLLFVLVGFTAFICRRYRTLPFVAIILATCLFCLLLRTDLTWVARSFHSGFGQSLAAGGLTILAGLLVAAIGQAHGAMSRWREAMSARARALGLAGLSVLAGIGGTPLAALAVLHPVLVLIDSGRRRAALRMAAIVNAMQGSVVPGPLPIAALAVLGADWQLMLLFGLPLALAQILLGWVLVHHAPDEPALVEVPPPVHARNGVMWGYGLAVICLVAMVIFNALGQIPTEPLGSGNTREQLIRLGLPFMLMVVGIGFALVPAGPAAIGKAFREDGTIAGAMPRIAVLLLTIGAAGGLQLVLHQDGFASLVVEHVAEWPPSLGLALPFALAAISRALQGTPMTAVITAAGVMLPLLGPMGLDDAQGRALVGLAITTGAMAAPHIQDGYFWMACHQAGLRADQGLRWITLTAMLQAGLALGLLMMVAVSLR